MIHPHFNLVFTEKIKPLINMAILCRKIGSVRFLSNRLNYRKKLKYRLLKSIFHFLPIHSLLCIIVYIFRCVPYLLCIIVYIFRCVPYLLCIIVYIFRCVPYLLCIIVYIFRCVPYLLCIIVYIFRCVPYFARITSWSIVMFLTYEQLKIHFMSPKAATVKPVFPVVEKL